MSPRTFARMVTAAVFSDIGDRSFRASVHGDVLDQPAYLLVTAEQHDELKRTSRMGDLVILGDGSLVYLTIPVKIHYGEDAEKIYSDALDLRELPTRW